MMNPTPKTLVSEVKLGKQRGACIYNQEDKSVAVQVSLIFNSSLGPRSKIYKGDKPNFAYPYFIAVTSPNGEIVAKEVFAASISYKEDQKSLSHKETLRQIIPLEKLGEGPDYTILAGFQLTEEQLEYNRTHPVIRPPLPHATSTPEPITKPSRTDMDPVIDEQQQTGGTGKPRQAMDLTEPLR